MSLKSLFAAIADKLRIKTGTTRKIKASNFPDMIDIIVTLDEGTADGTAVAADLLCEKTAYVDGNKITGSMVDRGTSTTTLTSTDTSPVALSANGLQIATNSDSSKRCCVRPLAGYYDGTNDYVGFLASRLGDATAADVVSEKTFTSSAGLKMTGTLNIITSSTGKSISSLNVGDSVYIKVNGISKEFIIVHKGNPSTSLYDSSCNGVWVMMKELFGSGGGFGPDGKYANSYSHRDLNITFCSQLETEVLNAISYVKIPYRNATSGSTITSGSNGLITRVFSPSGWELGCTTETKMAEDGIAWSYFSTDVDSNRIAYNNSGSAAQYWVRSGRTASDSYFYRVTSAGALSHTSFSTACYLRPTMIFPNTTRVDSNNNILGLPI